MTADIAKRIEFRSWKDSKDYWWCEFIDYNGVRIRKTNADEKTLFAIVEKHLAKWGTYDPKQGKRGERKRTETSGIWGRPTKERAEQKRIKVELDKLLADVRKRAIMATTASAGIGSVMITADIAEKALNEAYNGRGNYNTYTGNLERAYKATVIQGRNIKRSFFLKDTPKGNNVKPNHSVEIFGEKKHDLGTYKRKVWRNGHIEEIVCQRRPVRYFKRWEKKRGYRDESFTYGRNRVSGFGRLVGDNLNRVQSGIILENAAPYSMYVEQHYKVIPAGLGRRYVRSRGEHQQMLLAISKNMLKAAKLL